MTTGIPNPTKRQERMERRALRQQQQSEEEKRLQAANADHATAVGPFKEALATAAATEDDEVTLWTSQQTSVEIDDLLDDIPIALGLPDLAIRPDQPVDKAEPALRLRRMPEIVALIEVGLRGGGLTLDELNDGLPASIKDVDDFEEVFDILKDFGIDLVDERDVIAPKEARRVRVLATRARARKTSPVAEWPAFDPASLLHSAPAAVDVIEGPPTGRVARPRRPIKNQRVPLLPPADGFSAEAVAETSAKLSRVGLDGERLVLELERRRWRSALQADAETVAGVFSTAIERYWDLEGGEDAERLARLIHTPDVGWLDDELFNRLIWPSQTELGARMGFDILALHPSDGGWRCLEVKTTTGSARSPFFLSVHELETAGREGERYEIVRVSGIYAGHPQVEYWGNPAHLVEDGRLDLLPTGFEVRISAATPAPLPPDEDDPVFGEDELSEDEDDPLEEDNEEEDEEEPEDGGTNDEPDDFSDPERGDIGG